MCWFWSQGVGLLYLQVISWANNGFLSRGVDKGHGTLTLFLHNGLVCWSYTCFAYCFTGHSADLDLVHFGSS